MGTINVGGLREAAFNSADAELLRLIAEPVAITVENTLNFEREAEERERAQILLEINNAIATSLDLRDLLRETSECLRKYFKHDFAGMALYDEQSGQRHVHALDASQLVDPYVEEGLLIPLEETPVGKSYTSRQSVLIRRLDMAEFPSPFVERAVAAGFKSSCNATLIAHDIALGSVVVVSRERAGELHRARGHPRAWARATGPAFGAGSRRPRGRERQQCRGDARRAPLARRRRARAHRGRAPAHEGRGRRPWRGGRDSRPRRSRRCNESAAVLARLRREQEVNLEGFNFFIQQVIEIAERANP